MPNIQYNLNSTGRYPRRWRAASRCGSCCMSRTARCGCHGRPASTPQTLKMPRQPRKPAQPFWPRWQPPSGQPSLLLVLRSSTQAHVRLHESCALAMCLHGAWYAPRACLIARMSGWDGIRSMHVHFLLLKDSLLLAEVRSVVGRMPAWGSLLGHLA